MKTFDLGSDCIVCWPFACEELVRCAITWPRRREVLKCLAVLVVIDVLPDVRGFESREKRSMSRQRV